MIKAEGGRFYISTANSTYMMRVLEDVRFLEHVYYGPRLDRLEGVELRVGRDLFCIAQHGIEFFSCIIHPVQDLSPLQGNGKRNHLDAVLFHIFLRDISC